MMMMMMMMMIFNDNSNTNHQHLKTNAEGVCCFKDIPFTTSAGPVTCEKFPNNHIS